MKMINRLFSKYVIQWRWQYQEYMTSMREWLMIMEQTAVWELSWEAEALEESLPHCQILRYKSHITWPWIELEPPWWEAVN
jgi:hypothetical protein